MKKILIAIITLAIGFSSCQKASEEIFELEFERLFRPMGLTVNQTQVFSEETLGMQVTATFTWAATQNAIHYEVEFTAGAESEAEVTFETGTGVGLFQMDGTRFVMPGLPVSTWYGFRVRAIAHDSIDEEDSGWYQVVFRTDPEQLFLPILAGDIRSRAVNLSWYPVEDVQHITITPGLSPHEEISLITLTQEDIANATLRIEDLSPSTQYTVTIFTNYLQQQRGERTFTTRPGVDCRDDHVFCLVTSDDSLAMGVALRNALQNPANIGKIVYLPEGFNAVVTGSIAIAGSMHIFGNADGDRPRVTFVAEGEAPRLFVLPGQADTIMIENIEFIGGDSPPFYYIINQTEAANIGTLLFESTVFRNFGEGGIRLQGSGTEEAGRVSITNLIVNNSVVSRVAHERPDGRFAFINISGTQANGRIDNVRITNSTFHDIHHSFMNLQGHTGVPVRVVETITIENVTFDRVVTSHANTRYFIDGHTHSNIAIVIRNTIFGSTHGPLARGIRIADASPAIDVTNSFRTNDWVTANPPPPSEVNFHIPDLTNTNGSREALFYNPDEGDFTLRVVVPAGIINAGDPRWRP